MPRSEEANRRIREAQRERIVEGAMRAFAGKGLSATMSDVAESAGVSQGLAYRYFSGKEALFTELLEGTARLGQSLHAQVRALEGSAVARLDFLLTKSLEELRGRIGFYRLFAQEFDDGAGPTELCAVLREYGRDFQELLRGLIVEAQMAGEISMDDPDQLVMVVTACLDGLLRMCGAEERNEKFPDSGIILRILGL